MTLSDLSIRNPVFAWMVMLGVFIFGLLSYKNLGVSLMPDVDSPVLTISTSWSGASPEVMEKEVTDVLEEAIMGIEGIKEVTSSSSRGNSRISVEFVLEKNIDIALQDLQARVLRAQRNLPRDVDTPIITKSNPEDMPIIWLSVTGNKPQKFLMEYTKDYLQNEFASVKGVAEINVGGYVAPALRVWVDPKKLDEKEITADDIVSAIATQHKEQPAGYLDTGREEINLRILGEAGSVEEIQKIIIPSRQGAKIWKPIKIGDVADVEDGLQDIRNISRTDGTFGVGLGIMKQRGENSVEVAKRVKQKVNEVKKRLPEGVELKVRFDTTKFIEETIADMVFIIILSVILTSLVCYFFLGSIRAAISVFLTIPMSIIGTFFFMKLFGFTMNTFTLLAISLVIGIVVDDAIMVTENISRHHEKGEPRIKAAIKGSREITFAALAATIAIIAIFIPVVFMEGVIGRYFFQFGITLSVAVALSLLGALTVTPMLLSQFMKKTTEKDFSMKMYNYLISIYKKILTFCLNHRWLIIILSTAIFLLSLTIGRFLKKEFVPAQDQGRLMINIQMPPGTSIAVTDDVFKQAEDIIKSRPEVDNYFVNFSSSSGMIFVTLQDKNHRKKDPKTGKKLTQQQIGDLLRQEIRKIKSIRNVAIRDPSLSMMGGGRRGYPVEFILVGPDWDKLAQIGQNLAKEMQSSGKMVDADTDYRTGIKELYVIPDRQKAFEYGVNISTIASTLSTLFGGNIAGKYTKGGKRYDIIVQFKPENRREKEFIKNIKLRNNRGELVKLSSVANFVEEPALVSITRQDRQRAVRVYANVASNSSQGEAIEEVQKIAKKLLPEGYFLLASGGTKGFSEAFGNLMLALVLGIVFAYMVLGVQFNSFVHPFTVLLALPFSVTGAFIALILTGNSLNIYSMIGLILLMGIVKKNSILLVDFTVRARERGMDTRKALEYACPIRLRPIIMTSVSTIAAAIPPALALGPGAESRIPMAVVVIGGVIFSTLLTLFIVPVAFSLLSRFESKKHMDDVREAMKELEKEK
ncbi:MAG: efflux RND transporter permease subunit [Candidatus Goldbacteria bacterium]|nr:efflux RND transporter permease subunit [Candidatus Goldiibacteriota bacterium]